MLNDILQIVFVLFPLIIGAEDPNATGAQKKAQVIKEIGAILDAPGGLDWPSFLPRDFILGFLIDGIVKYLNLRNFFSSLKKS